VTPAAVIRDIQLAGIANLPSPVAPVPPLAPEDVNQQPAKQLLADARKLQKEGKLSEARAKVVEAQKLNVTFAVDEETPDRVLLELASLCKQRVESLVQQAGDYAATAQQDAARFQKAEADLNQARELAKTFGLDAQPIEVKVAWVKQQQTSGAAPASTQPATPAIAATTALTPTPAATESVTVAPLASTVPPNPTRVPTISPAPSPTTFATGTPTSAPKTTADRLPISDSRTIANSAGSPLSTD